MLGKNMPSPKTMLDKIWDAHVVHSETGKQTMLYIDLHLVHESQARRPSRAWSWPVGECDGPS